MSGKFLSQKVMSVYKHEEAVRNSQVNRGEYKRSNTRAICVCGCDDDGSCHFEYDPSTYYDSVTGKYVKVKGYENRSDQ